MRKGGGKDKGSSFERATGKILSQWLTRGRREDLFSRNVLSGGQFTVAKKKDLNRGTPGDLVGIDPLAVDFLNVFFVECKHYKSLGLEAFMFDKTGKSFLAKVIAHCEKQGEEANRAWLIIAKQNMRPSLLITSFDVGAQIIQCSKKPLQVNIIKDNYVFFFESVVSGVPIKQLIKNVTDYLYLTGK